MVACFLDYPLRPSANSVLWALWTPSTALLVSRKPTNESVLLERVSPHKSVKMVDFSPFFSNCLITSVVFGEKPVGLIFRADGTIVPLISYGARVVVLFVVFFSHTQVTTQRVLIRFRVARGAWQALLHAGRMREIWKACVAAAARCSLDRAQVLSPCPSFPTGFFLKPARRVGLDSKWNFISHLSFARIDVHSKLRPEQSSSTWGWWVRAGSSRPRAFAVSSLLTHVDQKWLLMWCDTLGRFGDEMSVPQTKKTKILELWSWVGVPC